jgi:SAM-dependent methyltransferase
MCDGPFLRRDDVSIHQNLLVDDPASARGLRHGTLEMHACRQCGFVFNAAFEPQRLRYGAAYDNTQTLSPAFERHVDGLAGRLLRQAGPGPHRIVEVGCGKGGFLRMLVERNGASEGLGFDPSYLGPDGDLDGRLRFERRLYDRSCAWPDTDVIVCRHVIEHIADPLGLLRTVRQTIGSHGALVFFETPCVEWILEHQVVWDLFYEHCSYFSAGALRYAFEAAGFAVDDIAHVFGGQYLWVEARPVEHPLAPLADDDSIARKAASLAAHEAALIQGLRGQLADLLRAGPVAICGAGAKGVTLAALIDPDCRLVACIADLNPNKQGRFLPGTGHPIVSPRDLAGFGVKSAMVTNPNYLQESSQLLREIGLDIELVNLMRAEADADTH